MHALRPDPDLTRPSSPASSNLIQDISSETPDLCHAAIKHKDIHVTWGQSVHLPCKFNGFIQESQDLQQLLAAQQRTRLQQQQQTQPFADYNQGLASSSSAGLGQPHGLVQPASFIQWYYHRRDNILSPGFPVLQRRDKFILAADQGLVILNANEPGWYQCRLGNQIIYSYNLIIDTSKFAHTIHQPCAADLELTFLPTLRNLCGAKRVRVQENLCRLVSGNRTLQAGL